MDYKQRSEFWDKLLALEGKDKNADQIELNKSIFLPRYLYRYRPVTMRSLDALRTNKLYFSTANYYDDPFDTFIHVDLCSRSLSVILFKSAIGNRRQNKCCIFLEAIVSCFFCVFKLC